MAHKIVWSAEARHTYLAILEHLEKEWSEKEVRKFVQRVHQKLSILIEQPAIGRLHKDKLKIYITLLTKHTSLVYHIKPQKKEIILLTFWDTRQNPSKLRH